MTRKEKRKARKIKARAIKTKRILKLKRENKRRKVKLQRLVAEASQHDRIHSIRIDGYGYDVWTDNHALRYV